MGRRVGGEQAGGGVALAVTLPLRSPLTRPLPLPLTRTLTRTRALTLRILCEAFERQPVLEKDGHRREYEEAPH